MFDTGFVLVDHDLIAEVFDSRTTSKVIKDWTDDELEKGENTENAIAWGWGQPESYLNNISEERNRRETRRYFARFLS